jgi:O-antigen biosynthesis protein
MDHKSERTTPSPASAIDGNGHAEPDAPPSGSDDVGTGKQQDPGLDHGSAERYEQAIDLDSDTTHARVVRLVGTNRRLLELGPATGHMSRLFRDRGCSVVGIEVDPEMAALAAQYCERIIVGDLDTLDLDGELGSDRFDVIVAADVLEHLKDPLAVLRRLRGFLAPDGFLVISLPNVAHGSVRLALLEGHFAYRSVGLLDETHLRFFTRESIDELLDEAELGLAEVHRQELNIDASEIQFDPSTVPGEVIQALERDPEARTYQFVIKAIPFATPGLREIQRRLRELAHENARLRDTPELEMLAAREAHLRSALIDTHDQLLRRDEEIHQLREELVQAKQVAEGELAALREEALRLRVRLQRIHNSPPMRALALLRALPGIRSLKADRTAGYREALSRARGTSESPG